jgi:Uma2 family endonuclease
MSPATTNPTTIPSLDELYEMTSVPDHRVVIRGVDWAFYEQLVDSIPEGANIHVDYDGKDLEIIGKSRKHERIKELLGYFVRVITEELETPYKSLGETTWKRPEVARGLEADQCYYFQAEKLAADAAAQESDSDDIADYPNPDLAMEVDISPPQTDRAGIYSALAVAEVWRFTGDRVVIESLGDDGAYHPVEGSAFLPVRAEEIRRWVVEEDSRSEWAWGRRLRAWVRAELAPRLRR